MITLWAMNTCVLCLISEMPCSAGCDRVTLELRAQLAGHLRSPPARESVERTANGESPASKAITSRLVRPVLPSSRHHTLTPVGPGGSRRPAPSRHSKMSISTRCWPGPRPC